MTQSAAALASLARAKQLTEQMIEAARALQWERVGEMEITRRSILDQVFATDFIGADIPSIRILILSIVKLNEELEQIAKAGAESFAAELKALRQARSAVKAYDACEKAQVR